VNKKEITGAIKTMEIANLRGKINAPRTKGKNIGKNLLPKPTKWKNIGNNTAKTAKNEAKGIL
jgi:hypothetical protein